jgi:acyl-CoA dehydrogenase
MNDTEDTKAMLHEAGSRLLDDCCTPGEISSSETGTWPAGIWRGLQESGLINALDPQSQEQQLLDWPTLAVLFELSGEYATPVPWAETLLAQRHFEMAGLHYENGQPLTIAPVSLNHQAPRLTRNAQGWRLDGRLDRVPWGRNAHSMAIVAYFEGKSALVRLNQIPCNGLSFNEAHEPRDSFVLSGFELPSDAVSLDYSPENSLLCEAALARSLQMVGAMNKVLDLTLQFSKQRVQFGRPIAKFQAVQHLVAVQASHTAAASAAATAAVYAAQKGGAAFEIAAAKTRVSEAAGLSAKTAHQVHGAMGITKEYPLHFWTRRLLAWREEFGNEVQWAQALGEVVVRNGSKDFWALICDPSGHHDEIGMILNQEPT